MLPRWMTISNVEGKDRMYTELEEMATGPKAVQYPHANWWPTDSASIFATELP
jgi:hypothetical protein